MALGDIDDSDKTEFRSDTQKRTTVLLPEILDENLETLALTTGSTKAMIIRRAISEYLKSEGMQPDKRPKVSFSY